MITNTDLQNLTVRKYFSNESDILILFNESPLLLGISAYGDCCSNSYFVNINIPLNEAITLPDEIESGEVMDANPHDPDPDYIQYHKYTLGTGSLLMHNSSNGYYDGWVECQSYTHVIIRGLPGSGKSHLAKEFPRHKIYDDVLTTDTQNQRYEDIQKEIPVCLIDPRFCDDEILKRHFIKDTFVISFENDINQCLKNLQHRDNREVKTFLEKIHKIYKPQGFMFPVYK